VALLGNHLEVTVLLDSRKEGNQRLAKLADQGILAKNRIIGVGDIIGAKLADVEDLFEPAEYLDCATGLSVLGSRRTIWLVLTRLYPK